MAGGGLGAEAPHIFHTFIAQSRLPDLPPDAILYNFDTVYYSHCTWGWTTPKVDPDEGRGGGEIKANEGAIFVVPHVTQ